MTGIDNEKLHCQQVTDAYRASVRLRLYAVWAAAFGLVVMIGVLGAMLIGWLSVSEGLTWFGFAVLAALVPAANFYSDAARTTVNAAGLERQMGVGEDLYQGTGEYRNKVQRLTVAGLVVAMLNRSTRGSCFSPAPRSARSSPLPDCMRQATERRSAQPVSSGHSIRIDPSAVAATTQCRRSEVPPIAA